MVTLFGADGIRLSSGIAHEAHFRLSAQEQLTTINDSIRSQLSYYPLPSPAGSFIFRFDPALGAITRASDNFGPIYSQRAETTGKGAITFGLSFSRFTPDVLDGKNLDDGSLQVTFLHEPTCPVQVCPFITDTITGKIQIGITSNVTVLSATYGLLDNLDLSIALPIIQTDMKLTGQATINHRSQSGIDNHFFDDGTDSKTFHSSGSSWGPGDLVLRGKYNFLNTDPVLLAAGLDLQLPSGSTANFRGVGTPVISPVFIASTLPFAGVSPHANVGFHLSGDTAKFNNEFYWNLGADWSVVRPVTVVLDFLGRQVLNNTRLKAGEGPDSTEIAGSTLVNASVGVKVNMWKNLLGVANVLVPLNKAGLRDYATWMVGLEAAF